MKEILLINDMPGYGKVALSAMIPILTKYGHSLYNLPTAIISNPFNYGKFEILDTTEYMKETVKVWEELGFSYDFVAIGYLFSDEQISIIKDYLSKGERPVLLDPIMGDHGKLYNSITKEHVERMKEMVSLSDILIPNVTEGYFLAGEKSEDYRDIGEKLLEDGAGSVVLTSCKDEKGMFNFVKTKEKEEKIRFRKLDRTFGGSGDMFSALVIGEYLKTEDLIRSVENATGKMSLLMEKTMGEKKEYTVVPIEKYIELI